MDFRIQGKFKRVSLKAFSTVLMLPLFFCDEVPREYFSSKFTFSIGSGGYTLRLCCDLTGGFFLFRRLSFFEKMEKLMEECTLKAYDNYKNMCIPVFGLALIVLGNEKG